MKRLSRLTVLVFVCAITMTATLSAATDSGSLLAVQQAQARLMEAHRTLLMGVSGVEAARRSVAAEDHLSAAVLRAFHQRFWRQMGAVVALQKERSLMEMSPEEEQRNYLGRVDRAHRAALRLPAEYKAWREPAGAAGPECFGSISGTVQGPGGPLVNSLVQAFASDGASAGFGLTDGSGFYQTIDLPVGDYYVVTANADGLIDEVYDDVVCAGGTCDPTTGSAVAVSGGMTTAGIDFTLVAGGRIGGTTTVLPGPIPFPMTVNIFNAAGEAVTATSSDGSGIYLTETGLPDGSYRAVTSNFFGSLDELYDNIPCTAGIGCSPASGTAIAVTAPNTTSGINFELAMGGSIAGTVTDSSTTQAIPGVAVGIYDTSGLLLTFGSSDGTGNYMTFAGLATANYLAVTRNFTGYVDELYDDEPCTGGLCTITGGDTIGVVAGSTTGDIDFALTTGGTFSGTVTEAGDGDPIADSFVAGFTSSGGFVGTAATDALGQYTMASGLGTGSYRATTLNPYGYDDELYDDMSCPFGVCDVTAGTAIAVTIGVDTPGIDFDLEGNSIVSCDFEGCSTCTLDVVP